MKKFLNNQLSPKAGEINAVLSSRVPWDKNSR